MKAKAVDQVSNLSEHEFSVGCDTRGCREKGVEATWVGFSTHGQERCPTEAYSCDACMHVTVEGWARILASIPGGSRCLVCTGWVEGQVSDHLRFIHL